MPSACAPTIGRVASNVRIAADPDALAPSRARASRSSSFSLPPTRHEPGTRTSSRKTSAVCEARSPSFFSFLVPTSPGVPGGTMNAAWPREPSSGSTHAVTTCTLAMPPLVAYAFWPLRIHSSVASS